VDVQTIGKTIQLILAPVVMVTACGILLGGMLSHYAVINDRIRSLSAERLRLAIIRPEGDHVLLASERLGQIDHQVPMLIRRHHQMQRAILSLTSAVVVLVLSMFVIAAAALWDNQAMATMALFMFLGGTALLVVGVGAMAVEVRDSHDSVSYEAMRIVGLPVSWRDSTAP
jgi:hypothetical protein